MKELVGPLTFSADFTVDAQVDFDEVVDSNAWVALRLQEVVAREVLPSVRVVPSGGPVRRSRLPSFVQS